MAQNIFGNEKDKGTSTPRDLSGSSFGGGSEPPRIDSAVASSPDFDDTNRINSVWNVNSQPVPATLVITRITSVFQGQVEREWASLWIEAPGSSESKPLQAAPQTVKSLLAATKALLRENGYLQVVDAAQLERTLSAVTQRRLTNSQALTFQIIDEYSGSLDVCHQLEKALESLKFSDKPPVPERKKIPSVSSNSKQDQKLSRPEAIAKTANIITECLWSAINDAFSARAGIESEGTPENDSDAESVDLDLVSTGGNLAEATVISNGYSSPYDIQLLDWRSEVRERLNQILSRCIMLEAKGEKIVDALGFSCSLKDAKEAWSACAEDRDGSNALAPWVDAFTGDMIKAAMQIIKKGLPTIQGVQPKIDAPLRHLLLEKLKPAIDFALVEHLFPIIP